MQITVDELRVRIAAVLWGSVLGKEGSGLTLTQ